MLKQFHPLIQYSLAFSGTLFVTRTIALVLVLFLLPGTDVKAQGFDFSKLSRVSRDTTVPPAERIALGITFLQEELANPTPLRPGYVGFFDTGYVQSQIVRAISFPGTEAPEVLRRSCDQATDPRIKDLLTVALATAGQQDTAPDLIRILRKHPLGEIRREAIWAVPDLVLPPSPTDVPQRGKPGQVWRPLDSATLQAMAEALFAALQDPFKSYKVLDKEETVDFLVQEAAARACRFLGYTVKPSSTGWTVYNQRGAVVRQVTYDWGKAPRPFSYPHGH